MSSQLISLQFNNAGQDVAVINRLRTDLNYWAEIPMLADTLGTATLSTAKFSVGSTTLPTLIVQNNGTVVVGLSFIAVHGSSTMAANIPPGDFCYLPQVDYTTTIVSLTTASGTAPCIAWVGYS